MDARDRQASTLRANAARKAAPKREAALVALQQLRESGEPITFTAVARTAGVSRTYLYTKPDLAAQIRALVAGDDVAQLATDRSHKPSTIGALLRPRTTQQPSVDALNERIRGLEAQLAAAHEAFEALAREHRRCTPAESDS
ncbi:MAG: DUF6262 family protein [Steroidobacteraceae bacterium]